MSYLSLNQYQLQNLGLNLFGEALKKDSSGQTVVTQNNLNTADTTAKGKTIDISPTSK